MGNYIPSTEDERAEMLKAIGISSTDELYSAVPSQMKVKKLNIPSGMAELTVDQKVRAMAAKNKVFGTIFRGAGAYNHYIPSIVKEVTGKEEFLTAYTPYQAEISQGILQNIFEYQTMICELTGMSMLLKRRGVQVFTGARVSKVEKGEDGLIVRFTAKDKEQSVDAERVLVSIGRRANTEGLLAEGMWRMERLLLM